MAKTNRDLYRSVMNRKCRKLRIGVYPGNDILDPRSEDESYWSKKKAQWYTACADVVVVRGEDGPEVEPGGGVSLHDVSGWFPNHDFCIPEDTTYCDELVIKKDKRLKTSPGNPRLQGYPCQIECRTQMAVTTMKGCFNNMVRSAVARQCELANIQ